MVSPLLAYRIELAVSLNEFKKKLEDNEYEMVPPNTKRLELYTYIS